MELKNKIPQTDWERIILLGITGENDDWQQKLDDLTNLGISEAALFLERFEQDQRKNIYRALMGSSLKNIPLCHIRNDMEIEELVFLEAKFKTKYYTVHENSFRFLDKWPGFEKKLYLEMDWNDSISLKVAIERIGGFCVDFSHFKAASVDFTKEFYYTYSKNLPAGRHSKKYFKCNHLNGYNEKRNSDIHIVKSLKEFDYLKTLPQFLFGKAIGLETENEISEQIKFKNYLVGLLEDIFSKKDGKK